MYHMHKHAIHQWILALFIVAVNLLLFGQIATSDVLSAIGLSALTATTFIAFILPQTAVSRPKCLYFSYVVALAMGALCSTMYHFCAEHVSSVNSLSWETAFAVLAVALTMMIMMLFEIPHPPAAGLAIGLVLDDWDYPTVVAIFASISVIAFIKFYVGHRLKKLL